MPHRLICASSSIKERLRAARAQAEGRQHHVPVRRVIVRSPVRILRELTSIKMRCKVPCESQIEYDHYVVLDVRPDVIAFHVQPEVLHYEDPDGNHRTAFPDVRVHFTSGDVEMHEIKPDKEAGLPANQLLHKAITAEYARRGTCYRVVKESEVRRQPRLDNAHLLRTVRHRHPDRHVIEQVHSALTCRARTFGELQALLARGKDGGDDLLALARRGLVNMDWEHLPIGPDMPIALPLAAGQRQ
jgi:hypothetical protein